MTFRKLFDPSALPPFLPQLIGIGFELVRAGHECRSLVKVRVLNSPEPDQIVAITPEHLTTSAKLERSQEPLDLYDMLWVPGDTSRCTFTGEPLPRDALSTNA